MVSFKHDDVCCKMDVIIVLDFERIECRHDVILQYVARYEENVTPGMIASVPSQGNEQMAASILQVLIRSPAMIGLFLTRSSSQVGPIQLEAILGEAEGMFGQGGVPGGGGGLHPMMEGDDNMELLECQLGEEEGEEGDESPRPVKKEKSDRERF